MKNEKWKMKNEKSAYPISRKLSQCERTRTRPPPLAKLSFFFLGLARSKKRKKQTPPFLQSYQAAGHPRVPHAYPQTTHAPATRTRHTRARARTHVYFPNNHEIRGPHH